MPHAIVTGANGFIGGRLCSLLQRSGWTTTACGRIKQAGPWDDFIEWDVSETAPLQNNSHQPEAFFHLASKAHVLSEIGEDPGEYSRISATGTRNALTLALQSGTRRFVYFSSVKAMGEGNADYADTTPINESFPCQPGSPYGASKLAAEGLTLAARDHIEAVVIRPCMVYGPGSKGNLVKMAEAIRKNRFPPIPEFGNKRSVVHVDDLCRLALSAATNANALGQTFIAAEPRGYSTREMYKLILDALDKKAPRYELPKWILNALGHGGDLIGRIRGHRFLFDSDALRKLSENAWYDGSKAVEMLDFQYERSLPESLSELISQKHT